MKKYLIVFVLLIAGLAVSAQGLEFRLRGGANFQRSSMAGQEFSFLPHFGASAGIRISTIGIYGELLYSQHEEANGLSNLAYLIPSAHVRLYTYRFMYAELGLLYLMLTDDIEDGLLDNPDKEAGYYVGLGASFKKFEVGLRTISKPSLAIQITASYRF
ncbi:MAG: hypothetical protein V2I37_05395 [Marinilabiliaceae bacterium]|jgi:hypothetical protein|nr:hypothetical protein [Marinilabiliaceae bacterium]